MDGHQVDVTYRDHSVVANTGTLPWEIRDPTNNNAVLDWRVLLYVEHPGVDGYVVFVSREDIDAWVATTPGGAVPKDLVTTLKGLFDEFGSGQDNVRLVEQEDETSRWDTFSERYRDLADESGLRLGSAELFALAVERGIVNSIVLVDAGETTAEYVSGYRPRLPFAFVAGTAQSTGEGTLYDWPWPKETPNDAGKILYISAGQTTLPLSFVTMAAESRD